MTRQILFTFFTTCGSVLLAALTAFAVRMTIQLGAVSTRERAMMLGVLAADAIRFVAESAAADAKQGVIWTSAHKLSAAIEYMLRQTAVSRTAASDAIHAALPTVGEGATVGGQ